MPPTQTLNKAERVLKEIEDRASKEFLPIVGPHKGEILAEEVSKAKPMNVLEVGTLIGYSAILIGKELDAKARFVSIEQHLEETELAEENIHRSEIPPQIQVITGDAIEVIPSLEGCFEFAFIDAEKSEYYQYLRLAEDKLVKGAIIVADNAGIFADEMKDYLDYVRNSGKYRSRYVGIGEDGLEISVKL